MTPLTIKTAAGSLTVDVVAYKPGTPIALTGSNGFFSHTIYVTADQAREVLFALGLALDEVAKG